MFIIHKIIEKIKNDEIKKHEIFNDDITKLKHTRSFQKIEIESKTNLVENKKNK